MELSGKAITCRCGSTFWAEPPFSCCPRCDEPVLVPHSAESQEEFVDRIATYLNTVTEIRGLAETPPRPRHTPNRRRPLPRVPRREVVLFVGAALATIVIGVLTAATINGVRWPV